jgi:hypothetical protein
MNFKYIAIAVTLSVAASAALADDNQSIVLTPTGPGSFTGAFYTTESMSGSFVDTFTFNLPAVYSGLLGGGTLTFASMSGPVSLVVATLDSSNGVSVASPSAAANIAFPSALAYSNALAPITLTVLGFAGDPFAAPFQLSAGYSGLISFNAVSAVPEPETFALMLVGLGAFGFAAGRRRATRPTQST